MLPPELAQLEPLLDIMGYKWSTHVKFDDEHTWSMVRVKTNKAVRVGMNVAEAQRTVIAMASRRIEELLAANLTLSMTLRELASHIETS